MDKAIREAFGTPHIKMLENCTKIQLYILAALHLEATFSGHYEASIDAIFARIGEISHGKKFSYPLVLQNIKNLCGSRLIVCDGSRERLREKLSLNITSDDLSHVLASSADGSIRRLSNRLS